MLFRIILWSFILTMLFRFITRFLPVFQVTRMTQQKMKEMQKQMDDMQRGQQAAQAKKSTKLDGDYIDYEEVK